MIPKMSICSMDVKAVADCVTLSNNENGVADWIEKNICFSDWKAANKLLIYGAFQFFTAEQS